MVLAGVLQTPCLIINETLTTIVCWGLSGRSILFVLFDSKYYL